MLSKMNFFEGFCVLVVVVVGGGSGRRFNEEYNSFLLLFSFFGIPGKCSQENGTPENRSGVAGLRGEESWWWGLQDDDDKKDEEHEEKDDEEEEENDGVRREENRYLLAGNKVLHFLETIWSWPPLKSVAEDSICSVYSLHLLHLSLYMVLQIPLSFDMIVTKNKKLKDKNYNNELLFVLTWKTAPCQLIIKTK